MALRIYLAAEAMRKDDDWDAACEWDRQWDAELMEDKQVHRQV